MTPQQALSTMAASWGRDSQFCRFTHIFYTLVNPADIPKYTKPSNIDEKVWLQALKNNPDRTRLVPVQARGFGDLKLRIEQQEKAAKDHEDKLKEVQKLINMIQHKHQVGTIVKIDAYKRRHMDLASRILHVMAKIEVLRSLGYPILAEEEAFRAKLENLQRELNKPTLFKGRLNELDSLVRMQDEAPHDAYEPIDEDSLGAIHQFLEQQQEGLTHVVDVVKKDVLDLDLILAKTEVSTNQ